ncbi:13285_t:CDS:2, partial [Acaulospora morrowiae]
AYSYDQNQQQYLAPPGTQPSDYTSFQYTAPSNNTQPYSQYQTLYSYSAASPGNPSAPTPTYPPGVTPPPASSFQPNPPGVAPNSSWYSSTIPTSVPYQNPVYTSFDPNVYYQPQFGIYQNTNPITGTYPTYSTVNVPDASTFAQNVAQPTYPIAPSSDPVATSNNATKNTVGNEEKSINNVEVQQTSGFSSVKVNPSNDTNTGAVDLKS